MKCATCGKDLGLRAYRTRWNKSFCAGSNCMNAYEFREQNGASLSVRIILAILITVFLVFGIAYMAKADGWSDDPEVRKWFREQVDENLRSCCDKGDAPPVHVNPTARGYEFFWVGKWWPIPEKKIEWLDETPVNRNVVFFNYSEQWGMTIYCAKLLAPRG